MSLNNFTLVNARPSASASPTDIWEVEEKKTEQIYIMKVFITSILNIGTNYYEEPWTSILLNHELQVYQYLLDELIKKRNVRNILRLIDSVEFNFSDAYNFIRKSKVSKSLSDYQIARNLINNSRFMLKPSGGRKSVLYKSSKNAITMQEVVFNNFELYRANFKAIVSPVIEGGSLASYILQNIDSISPQMLMRYIYIIFITLSTMSNLGINQNDLHFGNVLIDSKFTGGPEFRKNYFLIRPQGDALLVDLESTLFIYDFDRAAVRGGTGPYKNELEGYKRGGNCPEFHPKRDFLKILCLLYHLLVDKKDSFNPRYKKRFERIRKDIITQLITNPTIQYMVRSIDDHACWLKTDYNDSIYCDEKLLDTGMIHEDDIVNWCFSYCSWHKNMIQLNKERICPGELELIEQFSAGLSKSQLKEAIHYNTQFMVDTDTRKKNQIREKLLNIILDLRK